MKKTITVFVLVALVTTGFAQSPGPFYRQFSFNPYLFNPGYVAINDQPELNVVYRKQWLNFKDAPVTTGISMQYPTSSRVSLGFNISSDNQVLLTNNTFMGTFGYVIPISNRETIRFGMSAGVGTNKLDLSSDELNLNDPAIINAANNNTYVDGNFGVVYTYGTLRLGFALTEIFKSNPFSTESFNKFSLSNLKNRLFSASYKFNVGLMENFAIEPYILYRQTEDGLQNSWEVASMIHYKDILWTGASYNQNNGLGLFLGMNVMSKFKFSYSYEVPPFNDDFVATSSHELHIGIQFGEKKNRLLAKNSQTKNGAVLARSNVKQPVKKVIVKSEPENNTEVEQIEETESIANLDENKNAISTEEVLSIQETDNVEIKGENARPAKSFTLSKGHYVVVGAFTVLNYAKRYAQNVRAKGTEAEVALNAEKKLYYVYIFSSFDIDEAKKVRNQYRLKNIFKEAWLFSKD